MNRLLPPGSLKLGFGLMRLPRIGGGNASGPIDLERTCRMVDAYLEAGGRYFDTAYIYEGSEEAIGKALVARYPRESFFLATKLNAASWAAKNAEEARSEFTKSLERTGAGYIDFYLIHDVETGSIKSYDDYDIWGYVKDLKAKGLIKHWGFSFHDSPELLEKVLAEHPDAEFVQLQINYGDWDEAHIQSGANYAVAEKHGVPVIVMEPVKGGVLADPPAQVKEIFREADPDASPSSWAIRFAASLPGVMMVLSGMSSEEQMADNLSYMKDFKPLSEEEKAVVERARKMLKSIDRIGCTACHYCTGGCPVGMHIPEIFSVMNVYKMYGDLDTARSDYSWRPGGPRASECVGCGQCETACPQHLPIVSLLGEVAATLE